MVSQQDNSLVENSLNSNGAAQGLIQARSLGKHVLTSEGRLQILDDINFSINAGTSVAILGASGSGKTTLLGLLAGLDQPGSGDVVLDNNKITEMDEDGRAQIRAGTVGFVFQNFQLLQGMTALENVMLPLELAAEAQALSSAQDILERVGLGSRLQHYPSQLSGGEQQRCAIARAFAANPKILFADEPTGNLDQQTGQKIIDLLFELNREKNTTLVMATHDEQLAERCDHRLHLSNGMLVKSSL